MIARLTAHIRQQWLGALALFLVLTGGVAYGADTIFSQDIVDGEVKSVDIGNNQIRPADVRNDSTSGGGLTSADIAPNTIQGEDVRDPTLSGDDVLDDSLTGSQIDESTLDLPGLQERAKRIDYDQPETDNTLREVGYQNGLHVFARCEHLANNGETQLAMFATSDFDATISSSFEVQVTATLPNGDPNNTEFRTFDRSQFLRLTPGDPPQLLFQPTSDQFGFPAVNNGAWHVMAQTVYRNPDAAISLDLEMMANPTTNRCQVYGTMLSATGSA